ncbi:chemokine XC receptor 1-like [Hoplias malabaricus]|uniref:chemokine XC receptor 1-like n=1 Tax=Hoplias malabaricus TaxID=27720 RepID=UPI003462D8ED
MDFAKFGSIFIPLFFIIVVLLSLVGNTLLLVVIGMYESLKSLTNIFIINLAVSDLIFTLGLPIWACYHIWGWMLGDGMCKGLNFIFYTAYYSSIVFLMLMTIQRYVGVVHPRYEWSRWQKIVFPILVWLFSFSAALPELFYRTISAPYNDTMLYCQYESNHALVSYERNILFVVAFLVIGFCYSRILWVITKSPTRRQKTIKLIICIVLVFFVLWAPYNIVIFLRTLELQHLELFEQCTISNNIAYAHYVCKIIAFSHCCINPVLYVFIGVKFRNHLRTLHQKILHKFHPGAPGENPRRHGETTPNSSQTVTQNVI